jgi:hypothetical protein
MQLSAIPVAPPHQPIVVAPRSVNDYGTARFSPDGKWVAYDLNESGRREVFVVSFPGGQGKVQISSSGGANARWSRGGRELFFSNFDNTILAVEFDGGRASTPRPLFSLPPGSLAWEVSADGNRFLVNAPIVKSSSVPLSLVLDWSAGLQK